MNARGLVSVVVFVLLCTGLGTVNAQDVVIGAEVVGGPVTPVVLDVDLRDLPTVEPWRPGDPVKEIPRRFFPRGDVPPGQPYVAYPDPLADLQAAHEGDPSRGFTTPLVTFAGIPYTGATPPDTVGDVGPNHYIQSVNGSSGGVFKVYDKAGAALTGSIAMESLGTGSCTSGLGDPIVLYDRLADRWFLQEFSSSGNYLCFYISQGPNPVTDGWYHYQFSTPSFPDYPHFGVWPDAYYGTANESSPSVFAIDRERMIAGLTARAMQRFTVSELAGYGFQTATPADLDGVEPPPAGAPGIIMRHVDEEAHSNYPDLPDTDLLEMWLFDVNWDTPASSTLTGPTAITITDFNSKFEDYSTFYSVPQPGSSSELDPIREVILQRLQYLNGSDAERLVGTLPTNLIPTSSSEVNAAMRWFELRRSGGGAWTLFQEGTFTGGPQTQNRFVGSIAMDQTGNMALAYSYTDTAAATPAYPSLRYTGRTVDDPVGVMSQAETQTATGTSAGSGRWGDYAAMVVDPSDDCTFFFTSEYQSGNWQTQVVAFRFDACGCELAIAPPSASAGVGGSNLILVSWNDSATPEISEYRVFRSFDAGGPYDLVATVPDSSPGSGGGAGYTYQDFDVSGGTEYFYVVRSSDGGACLSDPSNEASATATGDCTLAPLFAGIESVVNPATSQCTLELGWSAATSRCAGSASYNVYRSTTAGFVPDPSNQVASGVNGTAFTDTAGLASLTRHYYVVRAVDSVNGIEEQNTEEGSGVPTGSYSIGTLLDDAGDTGDAVMTPSAPWSVGTTGGHNGPKVYLTGTYGNDICAALTSATLHLGAGSQLSFWSKYQIENSWDKGVVEISSDGGSSWAKVPVNYPGNSTNTSDACDLPTGTYFTGSGTPTWAEYTASLATWAEQDVILRWRLSTDGSVTYQGWWVDEIAITNVMVPGDCDAFDPPMFADDFETGTTDAWSSVLP